MPEIAEVQVVRRSLRPLIGRTLLSVHVLDDKITLPVDELCGRTVTGLARHGKLLAFILDDQALTVHLRMTGALMLGQHPRARAILTFDAPGTFRHLSFCDTRRFGTLTVEPADAFAERLAVDLLDATPSQLDQAARAAARRRLPVKAVLLDQQAAVAGIGNYLADEAIGHCGGVHPAQPSCTLTFEQWRRLLGCARTVAEHALQAGGVSMRDYVHPDGSRGEMQHHLRWYGRAGKPCVRCAAPLAKTVVAGRGTTFCPSCSAGPVDG